MQCVLRQKTGMQCVTTLPYSMARAHVSNTNQNHNFIAKQDPLRSQALQYTYLTLLREKA